MVEVKVGFVLEGDYLRLVGKGNIESELKFKDLFVLKRLGLITQKEINFLDDVFDKLITKLIRRFIKYYRIEILDNTEFQLANKYGYITFDLEYLTIDLSDLDDKTKELMKTIILTHLKTYNALLEKKEE